MSIFSTLQSALTGNFSRGSGASTILQGGIGRNRLGSGTDAVANIQRTIDEAKYNAGKQQIMASVSRRIQGIAEGVIEPKEVWEKVAGFLAITGQPFTYSVSDAGEVEVTAQSLDEPGSIRPDQQRAMGAALQRLDEVRQQVDTVVTKGNLRTRLISAVGRIGELEQYSPAKEQWERDFQTIKQTGRPVLVGLDAEGNLKAINQLESNFDYVEDPDKRLALQQAGRDLQNILAGTKSATESWHYEVLGNKSEKDDYFLDVGDNNEIVVRRNKDKRGISGARPLYQQNLLEDFHIIPDFLKSSESDNRIFKANWEREAASLIQAKRPFHLEIVGDRVVVRETNFASARRQDLLNLTSGNQKIGQATVNILS